MKSRPRTPVELVHAVTQLASLTSLHLRLLEVLNDPGASLVDMVPLINRDPSLTARVLRRSNSAFFGRSGTITSVLEAIKMLGLGQMREIVLTTTVHQVFEKMPQNLVSLPEFWRHSVAVGYISRELARQLLYPDPDEAQTAGLLHDVGRLLMITVLPVEYHKLLLFAKAAQRSLLKVEFEHFGYTHAQGGGELFREWGFPLSLTQVAQYHHQPEEIQKNRLLASIVQMADVLAHALELGSSGETRIPQFPAGIWDEHGLQFKVLKAVMLDVESNLADALDLLLEG